MTSTGIIRATCLVGACSVLALGCTEPLRGPTGLEPGMARLSFSASVEGTTVNTLTVEVTAIDMSAPFVYNLTVEEGTATGTIEVPAGSDRLITISAFDANGIETHRGSATVDIVEGDNPPLMITLEALQGSLPIEVHFGSWTVAIEPDPLALEVGQTAQLSAMVTDKAGVVVATDVSWASANPAIATVDAAGLVTGIAEGTTRITAKANGAVGSVEVAVTAPAEGG